MNKTKLQAKNLYFRYPGSKKDDYQLRNINFEIQEGKWTTILGPNGSGKSTLAKLIAKLNKPSKGDLLFDDLNIGKIKIKEYAKKIAYVPQVLEVPYGTSVYDFVSFGRHPYLTFAGILMKKDKEIIKNTMQKVGVWQWKNHLMSELSGGERQKVLVALVMVQDADIILLDEPTTYLDIRNQYELLEMMHHQHIHGKTVIAILHDINQATQYSDYIYIMKDGKIHSHGSPSDTINKKTLKEVYGVEAKLYKDGNKKYITDIKLYEEKKEKKSINKKVDVHVHEHKHEEKREVFTKREK